MLIITNKYTHYFVKLIEKKAALSQDLSYKGHGKITH